MPAPDPATRDRTIRHYRAKRDFTRTPEPAPTRPGAATRQGAPIFVVQKHDATRLHYDFRLEHRGVLWSWAIPKGPSLDPGDKRLAVHVEDHPVDYAGFQGVIPEGNYGAGTVEIWDRGTWTPVGDPEADLARGELKFSLDGERLHGRFVLIRLKPRPRERNQNWLLIKEHDDAEEKGAEAPAIERARPRTRAASPPPKGRYGWAPPEGATQAALPASQSPMLATNADAPPHGAEWLSEVKFDGYRLLVFKDGGAVRLLTRNGLDWTHRLPTIAAGVARLPVDTLLADGELVALRPDGLSSFADLQAALSAERDTALTLYLFDLLHRDGWDLRAVPLALRKEALAPLLADPPEAMRYSDHLEGDAARIRAQGCAMGLEGIICKRADLPYRAGRSRAWLKVKCQGREEFVVLGWTPPQRSREGLGSLHLGFYDSTGALHYVGGVGTGFSDATLRDLAARLAPLAADPPAGLLLSEEPPPRDLHWVRPELVAEVQYIGWSGAGRLRHAVFLGLREDKGAAEIVRDVPNPEIPRHRLGEPRRRAAARPAAAETIRLTHPERELWPGITKADLAAYWEKVADTALPGIAHRPLALVRCPEGIAGEHFFQKHANRGMPAALHEGSCDGAPYLALADASGLLACAQMSAIELHGWGSLEADAAHPERLVFDLDPGEGVAWDAVIAAARDLRAALETEGLASFCRTSGGKGLHLVVPLTPGADWDTTRAWCRAFAEAQERADPARFVASVPKARRQGRILIDWLRNGLGSTAVCSFSPRARNGATVATPLAWREVTPALDPQGFTLKTIPARLARQKRDPWDGFAGAAQPLHATPSSKPRKRTR